MEREAALTAIREILIENLVTKALVQLPHWMLLNKGQIVQGNSKSLTHAPLCRNTSAKRSENKFQRSWHIQNMFASHKTAVTFNLSYEKALSVYLSQPFLRDKTSAVLGTVGKHGFMGFNTLPWLSLFTGILIYEAHASMKIRADVD